MNRLLLLAAVCLLTLSGCAQLDALIATPTPTPTLTPTASLTPSPTVSPSPTFTPSPTLTPSPTPAALAKLGSVDRDVPYCALDGVPVLMDVYYPAAATGLWPAVVIVHGGAWITGDKATTPDLRTQPGLSALGILVVSIDYRLAPDFPWPAMIEDVKCALRSLRAHARDYNVDPDRIGVMGDSVGGQLALLLALTDTSVGWDVGDYQNYSSQVQAAVDFFGPTDLNDASLSALVTKRGVQAFTDITPNNPELTQASPITYVRPDAPPIFIAQGSLDTTVPLVQSQMFYDRMKAAGAPVCLVVMQNGTHSFGETQGTVTPSYDQVLALSINFLASRLSAPDPAAAATPDPGLTACFGN